MLVFQIFNKGICMKKIIATTLLSGALGVSSLMAAEPHWYVGAEYTTGSGDRTYDYTYGTTTVDADSSGFTIKAGYMEKDFDKVELQYTSKTLENSNNSADKDDVTELKVNFVISIMKLSYDEMVIPYWEVALGYGDSDAYGGQFATHLGIGLMVNPVEQVELSIGYRLSTNIGTTDADVTYYDQHGDVVVGAAYRF